MKHLEPHEAPNKQLKDFSVEDLCDWLAHLGYSHYQNAFREKFISGDRFVMLSTAGIGSLTGSVADAEIIFHEGQNLKEVSTCPAF